MKLSIDTVTKDNYREILKLSVSSAQTNFIESTLECLTDANEQQEYKPVGLYVNEQLVGFAMYGYFPDETKKGRLWIDRLLIDAQFQGQGLGTRFMEALIVRVEKEYGIQPIYLSVYPENKGAIHIYQKFGFTFINEFDINGESIMEKPSV